MYIHIYIILNLLSPSLFSHLVVVVVGGGGGDSDGGLSLSIAIVPTDRLLHNGLIKYYAILTPSHPLLPDPDKPYAFCGR